ATPFTGQTNRVEAPMYEVDAFWPKPLPNHWVMGASVGIYADKQDHIWVLNRGAMSMSAYETAKDRGEGFCCASAPCVLEFDSDGKLVSHFLENNKGVPFEWPDQFHGIHIDYKGNVWLGSMEETIFKFTKDGKFLLQVGKQGRLTK